MNLPAYPWPGAVNGAKRSKSGKNRFQEGFLRTFAPPTLPGLLRDRCVK